MVSVTVKPLHFDDFSGAEFERLVLAYHLREGWSQLAWYGQTGSDQGRDIVGHMADTQPPRNIIIQCVNRTTFTQSKAEEDLKKAAAVINTSHYEFRFVCRCAVSAARRDAVIKFAQGLGYQSISIWAGSDFEEQLRLRCEPLLRRFFNGDVFPDKVDELKTFVDDFPILTDDEALVMMRAVFDRPAFQTPFQEESNLPAFLKAVEDTIGALNTGIWKDRENNEIRRIPSIHNLQNAKTRKTMKDVSTKVDALRRTFKRGLASGDIQHCGCKNIECSTFSITPNMADELNNIRKVIFDDLETVLPSHGLAVK